MTNLHSNPVCCRARTLHPDGQRRPPAARAESDKDGSGSTYRFYRGLTADPFLTFRLGQTAMNLDAAFTPDGKPFFWGTRTGR